MCTSCPKGQYSEVGEAKCYRCDWEKKWRSNGIEGDGTFSGDSLPADMCTIENEGKLVATLGESCTYMGFVHVPPGDWCTNETICTNFKIYTCKCVRKEKHTENIDGSALFIRDSDMAHINVDILKSED